MNIAPELNSVSQPKISIDLTGYKISQPIPTLPDVQHTEEGDSTEAQLTREEGDLFPSPPVRTDWTIEEGEISDCPKNDMTMERENSVHSSIMDVETASMSSRKRGRSPGSMAGGSLPGSTSPSPAKQLAKEKDQFGLFD